MTIRYANGRKVEGIILSRSDSVIRVAVEGSDDAERYTSVNGTWLSEQLEPVQVGFAWQRRIVQKTLNRVGLRLLGDLAMPLDPSVSERQ